MPNHITTKIEFYGEQGNIDKVLDFIKGDGECIDFNKIIPMPESLNIESGSTTDRAIAYYVTERLTIPVEQTNLNALISNMFDNNWAREVVRRVAESAKTESAEEMEKLYNMGKQYMFNRENYGFYTWYDWCRANWGTKWNAYDSNFDKDGNVIEFDTAWSCPIPVLDALAELCDEHDVYFIGKWADEDSGHNVGTFESDCCEDGCLFNYEHVENGSSEAYEIYIELKGESNCIGKDEDGNWVHYDCDSCPNANIC